MECFGDHIPLLKPWIDEDELREVEEVLRSGWISQGPKVQEFERQITALLEAPFVLATNSATSALHLAFQVAGLQHGDKVLVPAHTCMATVNGIVMAGGVPVFADIDRRTFNLDAAAVEAVLASDIRGICLVHQIGLPADVDAFDRLAQKRELLLVEDAATAFGAKCRGRYLGAHGHPTAFSLHPRKMITTAEGGLLVLHRSEQNERARRLRSAGADISDLNRHRAKGTLQQAYPEPGYNYRLTDVQAAIGIAQLRKLSRMLELRRQQARYYDDQLRNCGEILPPLVPAYAEHCYTSYCVTIPRATHDTITEILNFMAARNVSCRRGIQSLCREPYFAGSPWDVPLPNTDAVAEQTLFLPIFPGLTQHQQVQVVTALTDAVARFIR